MEQEQTLLEVQRRVPAGWTTEGQMARRYTARMIDTMVNLVLSAAVLIPVSLIDPDREISDQRFIAGLMGTLAIVYGAVFEASRWQATLGKKWVGLKVFGQEGQRLSFGKALLRSLIKEVPFQVLAMMPDIQILSVGLLVCHIAVVQWSPMRQAIHDKVVGTWVAARWRLRSTRRSIHNTPAQGETAAQLPCGSSYLGRLSHHFL